MLMFSIVTLLHYCTAKPTMAKAVEPRKRGRSNKRTYFLDIICANDGGNPKGRSCNFVITRSNTHSALLMHSTATRAKDSHAFTQDLLVEMDGQGGCKVHPNFVMTYDSQVDFEGECKEI